MINKTKEQQAISFLRSMECDHPLNLGFSGGKDSVVILDLAERAGIKYNAIYANTTVDPSGTISFIKKNYSQVQIMHPEKSFFKLVEEKGFPYRFISHHFVRGISIDSRTRSSGRVCFRKVAIFRADL